MDSSIIAVRIANGSFVKVLDTSSRTRRRLVLTTVRDGQTSVKIDLYRAPGGEMEDARYVSSLTIDDIEPADRGDPDIALLLGVDDNGNLNATAIDKKSGESQSLSVSLEAGPEGAYEAPDFQLSDSELTLDELSMDEELSFDEEEGVSMPLDEMTLEQDLTLEPDEPFTDTLAAADGEEGLEAEETDLSGLEEFSDDSVSFDASFAEEPLEEFAAQASGEEELEEPGEEIAEMEEADFDLSALTREEVDEGLGEDIFAEEAGVETEAGESEELGELEEGMVEAELGEEDFTFDESSPETEENLFEEAGESAFDDSVFAEDAELEGAGPEGPAMEDSLSPEQFERLDSEPARARAGFDEEQPLAPRRSNALIFVGYIILALAALGVLTYLVFRLMEGPPAPPLRAGVPVLLAALPKLRRRPRKPATTEPADRPR